MNFHVASYVLAGVLVTGAARGQRIPSTLPDTAAASAPAVELSVTPVLAGGWGTGNARRFAQDWWRREQSAGGVDQFKFNYRASDGWTVNLSARAIVQEDNYDVALNIVNPNVGFVRAGFVEYRKYFDDQGGYYPLFSTKSFSLDKDLHLKMGRIYVEAGLTLPNWPVLLVGLEEQFKDGNKSLLEWGGVQQTLVEPAGFLPSGSVTKRIFPSYEHINETTHILKASIEDTLAGVHVKDEFHYEWNKDNTARYDMVTDNLTTALAKRQIFNEGHDNGQGFNTVTVDNRPYEKIYWSAGHLYTKMNGDYGLHIITSGLPVATSDRFWFTNAVNLGQDSNVSDFNVMIGPFDGASLSAGLRGEDTHNHGFADVVEANVANPSGPRATTSSNTERKEFESTLELRYTKVPLTTLYANARFLDGQVDDTWLETGDSLGDINLVRRTDVWRQNYTAGFNTASIAKVSLSGRYRHSIRENKHGNSVDVSPDDGIIGLFANERLVGDDYMLKATMRATGRLQLFASYQYATTTLHTRTRDVSVPRVNPPVLVPPTDMDAGSFLARTFSLSTTWTPLARLYFSGVFNFQRTVSDVFRNGANSVQPYRSSISSVLVSGCYAVNNKTDVNLEYSFIRANSLTDHFADANPPAGYVSNDYGMPYGTRSSQHGLTVNLTHIISEGTTARFGVDYFKFNDSANAGITDYTAYGVVAAWTIRY
jgi:hypothetical protein